MGRKPLNETEREQKRLFDEELRKHSLDALKNILKIANNAMDAKVRLQANQWLVEKAYGKDYQAYKEDQEQQQLSGVTINLISTPKQNKDDEEEDWNSDDNSWEDEVYIPHKEKVP